MPRRLRGVRVGRPAPLLISAVISLVIASACIPSPSTPSTPSPGIGSPVPPSTSPGVPTPVPTVRTSPAPATEQPSDATGLVVRLTSCSHTCGPTPGTTVLADGRVIWERLENRAMVSRLSPEALQHVVDTLAIPELAADGDYQAELRPGAKPVGRGATLYRLELSRNGRRVVVTFGDPTSYADERDRWIIPPEMTTLAALAGELRDPVQWLGQASFGEDPQIYEPDRFLVLIDLFPDVGEDPGFDADVDDVEWPFGEPIEGAGEPVETAGGFGSRCLIVTSDVAETVIAAEESAGAHRQRRLWLSTVQYRWKRSDGLVQVSLLPILPYEQGSCVDLASEAF